MALPAETGCWHMRRVRIESCEVNVNIWTIMISSRRHLEFYIKADMIMNRGYFKVPLKKRLLHLVSPDYIILCYGVLKDNA